MRSTPIHDDHPVAVFGAYFGKVLLSLSAVFGPPREAVLHGRMLLKSAIRIWRSPIH